MRKIFVLFLLPAMLWSCGNNEEKTAKKDDKTSDPTKHPDYQKGFDLISKNDCFSCHKVGERLVGPAYMEVAQKYAGQDHMIDTLAHRVINGSVGHWGQVPMTPHQNLSVDDARAMVKYILTLNQ